MRGQNERVGPTTRSSPTSLALRARAAAERGCQISRRALVRRLTLYGNNRGVFLTAFPGFVLVLQATCAFASGREGEALVAPVLWIVAIVLVAFATLVFGGGVLGAFRAGRSGESIRKGGARGLLRGMVAFLVVGAVSVAGLTFLGILWVAYSFLYVYVLNPS